MRNLRATPTRTDNYTRRFFQLTSYTGTVHGAGLFIAALIFIAVMVVGLFYVRTRMALVEIGYEVSSLEKKNRDLKKRATELTLKVAFMESPGDLEKKASKVGLVFPSVGKVVHVP
jgi:cell division protein FtsL